MMAPPRHCQSIKFQYPRTGTGVRVQGTLERGGAHSREVCALEQGGAHSREVWPRARRSLLEGIFEWAALVGRRGHCGVGHAPCV
jgi:hypothetical protein